MKLAAHYSKASIFASLAVLFVGGFVYYFALRYTANVQLDRNLKQALYEAEDYVKTSGVHPRHYDIDQDHAVFIKTDEHNLQRRFFDTIYRNPEEKTTEDGRAVQDIIEVNNVRYKATITISRESTSYLIEVISLITLALVAGLIGLLFITNKYILKGLWQPFYSTLNQIKAFNIANVSQFDLKPDKVDEFTELNSAIHEMSLRVQGDYQKLKEFTETASHEMMTPLAIVTTKLDTLIQDETLNSQQLDQITDTYSFINKSIRLNKSLLLLVKLDHNLIKDNDTIALNDSINEKVLQFRELIQNKGITINTQLAEKQITVSKHLIDILLNNLFSNAINHNHKNGEIAIELSDTYFIIKNTGINTVLDTDKLFERFQKGSGSSGTGLGLTLVKNICIYYGYDISYSYTDNWHIFKIHLS